MTSQRIRITVLGCQLGNLSELNNFRFRSYISMNFCLVVDPHKTKFECLFLARLNER